MAGKVVAGLLTFAAAAFAFSPIARAGGPAQSVHVDEDAYQAAQPQLAYDGSDGSIDKSIQSQMQAEQQTQQQQRMKIMQQTLDQVMQVQQDVTENRNEVQDPTRPHVHSGSDGPPDYGDPDSPDQMQADQQQRMKQTLDQVMQTVDDVTKSKAKAPNAKNHSDENLRGAAPPDGAIGADTVALDSAGDGAV